MNFSASDRVARLLALIPWVAAQDGVALDDIADRFAYPRGQLADDLANAVFYVGVHPFTPDTLIEVTIDDDRVWIRYADWFSQPMKLTSEQALALLAAGRSILAVADPESTGPLLRGLAKLAAATGLDDRDSLDIRLGDAHEETLDVLRGALNDHRAVRIDYYSYGRDERTDRIIEPHRFFADEGHWYVQAFCRSADDMRLFRLDRVRSTEALDDRFKPPEMSGEVGAFRSGVSLPVAILDLAPGAHWVRYQYPTTEVVELADDIVRVHLPVAAVPWLERLLLRLGPDAQLVEWADDPHIAAAAATRLLTRYRP